MIEISNGQTNLPYQRFTFPGGEIGIKLSDSPQWHRESDGMYLIRAGIGSADDLIALAMIKDALERVPYGPFEKSVALSLPYVPYARQDRVCVPGESFSLKVLAQFINHLNFSAVGVLDPHSDVLPALIDRVHVYTQLNIIQGWLAFQERVKSCEAVFVSPDAGGNKKTAKVAAHFGATDFVRADKLRDLSTGKILETKVYVDDLSGKHAFICDDICDGGMTFIELAKVLKSKGADCVVLLVTHGIFSKGLAVLHENGIDEIWTTDSFPSQHLTSGAISCLPQNIPTPNIYRWRS